MNFFPYRIADVICFAAIISVIFTGCKSDGTAPSNPFALNRQMTVPPPATFSSQGAYLGQVSPYSPQTPASAYPSSTTQPAIQSTVPANSIGSVTQPTPIPANMPLPSVSPQQEMQTIDGASRFQASTVQPAETWTAASVPATAQTAFQNLESKNNSVSVTNADGTVSTSVIPDVFSTASTHIVTQITDSGQPAAVAQPQQLYSGEYLPDNSQQR
jgi:hypothetical protein